ncbi:cyclin-dependent kinase B2-2 [Artemisia annua]|uniref:Cyclin-dependent kinase B2-2 n=1 Tax=Artemisia annua TaxID=35608 RepID=A0A2U1M3A9_ARTAN|nr:cyclin-dependent kinase B2-2 [Artemisia annua]
MVKKKILGYVKLAVENHTPAETEVDDEVWIRESLREIGGLLLNEFCNLQTQANIQSYGWKASACRTLSPEMLQPSFNLTPEEDKTFRSKRVNRRIAYILLTCTLVILLKQIQGNDEIATGSLTPPPHTDEAAEKIQGSVSDTHELCEQHRCDGEHQQHMDEPLNSITATPVIDKAVGNGRTSAALFGDKVDMGRLCYILGSESYVRRYRLLRIPCGVMCKFSMTHDPATIVKPVPTMLEISAQQHRCSKHAHHEAHNLLMDRTTFMLKIADLGLAQTFTVPLKEYTHKILSLWYRAHEVLLGAADYSTAVDM